MPMRTFWEYIFYPGENKNYKPIPVMEQVCEWDNGKQRVVEMEFPPIFMEFFSYDKML